MPGPSRVCNLHHSSGQTGSLTHWVRPGIEPTSSRILVGFVTEPWRELPFLILLIWATSLFFLMSLGKGLSTLLTFSKNQLLFYLFIYPFIHVFIYFAFYGCTCGIWNFPGQRSNPGCSYQPTTQPQQHKILSPLSKARDWTSVLMNTGFITTEPWYWSFLLFSLFPVHLFLLWSL